MIDSINQKYILVAEDDIDDRELFSEALASFDKNIVIYFVENGIDALKKLDELTIKPDVIFLDINMPVMNGWDCLKVIKKDSTYKHIPVVIYSSSSHMGEQKKAIEMGATLFFTKPNDFYQFREKLEVIINNISVGK